MKSIEQYEFEQLSRWMEIYGSKESCEPNFKLCIKNAVGIILNIKSSCIMCK